jgi:4-amino-4-deoxy-L-arabinose transferase-like glycosyltransferase
LARPALVTLLAATAVLYLWALDANGWANSFYSAAAQAGSESWSAMFYGASDAAGSITVDKTPAALWVTALSVRLFGLNPWAVLVPEALAGVASVAVLYAAVRRWYGPAAGLLAGAVLALTPVAVLMFRFNNPDALLVLLLVAGAWATVRAVETGAARWLLLAGVLVGFGYLTKMLQAFLVVPAFAGMYLLAAPVGWWRRVRHLLLAGVGLLVAAGWWVAVVELVPGGRRPYVGGSQHDSVLELTFGYNGLGRLTGTEEGRVGGGQFGPTSGRTGWLRLFDTELGGQVSWLLPAALLLLVAGLVVTARRRRTDTERAGLLLWGGWLLVTGVTFSFMRGIFHAYYTVALAPAVAALVGAGAVLLWRRRGRPVAAVTLAVAVAGTAAWSWVLLDRTPDWRPWLRVAVAVVGLTAAVAVAVAGRLPGRLVAAAAVLAACAVLAGPAAYAVQTVGTAQRGAIPSAGPPGQGGPFGAGFRAGRYGPPPGLAEAFPLPPGGPGAADGGRPGDGVPAGGPPSGVPGGFTGPPGAGPGRRGGPAGLLDARAPGAQLVALLEQDSSRYTWVAATVGSNNAAGLQLATGDPVMPVGGFNGSDPSPTLARFQEYVRQGRIHWFVGGGGFPATGGSRASAEIAAWVAATFTARTVDGTTVYDLSGAREGAR